jgi:hypothetical protein
LVVRSNRRVSSSSSSSASVRDSAGCVECNSSRWG